MPAGIEEPIAGHVTLISPALDPGSTTIEVWVEAIKPNAALKPGMNVEIKATAKSVKDALVVPASAFFKTPETGEYVLLADPTKSASGKSESGTANKELAEIQSGIKENDAVITQGGYARAGRHEDYGGSSSCDRTEKKERSKRTRHGFAGPGNSSESKDSGERRRQQAQRSK